MKYYLGAFLFSLLYLFFACQSAHHGPLHLERQHYVFGGSTRCDTISNTGIDVSVSYIQLKEDTEGARNINDSLRRIAITSVTEWLDQETVASHPDACQNLASAVSLLADDYESIRKDMGGLGGCWELETTADTLHASSKALTVKMETYAYTGGAHPNSSLTYYTFDRETGRLLTLADMVSDTTALLGVLEREFRQHQKLLPLTSLEEQGYFLRDGHFFLPANVGASRDGLVFYYNPYEIAAYAIGPIRITVPYEKLSGILRDDWL